MEQPKAMSRALPGEAESNIGLQRTKKQLDDFAFLMDQYFRIPGLGWRFGLEAIIGLVPGAGDVVSGAFGLLLLVRAFQFKLPYVVIVRMILNTLIDIIVGAIPVIGDAFDFFWKSNTRNMKLFHEYAEEPGKSTTRHFVFLLSLILGFIGVLTGVMVFLIWLILNFFSG